VGGFYLPFISIGSVGLALTIALFVIVPNVKSEEIKDLSDGGKSLTFSALVKVRKKIKILILKIDVLTKY